MRSVIRSLLAAGLMLLALPAAAQPDLSRRTGITVADTGATGYRFERFSVASADGQRRYRVRVAVPDTAAPEQGFPVAYLVDGNAALMETDAALLSRLAAAPRPPVIAYIAHDNDLRIDGGARAFDYTPRRPGDEEVQNDVRPGRRNGGADAFLGLIGQRIVPQVETLAKVDPARRALWGHSYGGVLVLHALFSQPQSFTVYAAADPSLWWGDGQLLREEAAVAEWPSMRPALYLWVGQGGASGPAHGHGPGRKAAPHDVRRQLPPDAPAQMTARLRASGLEVRLQHLPGLSHGQTLGASLPPLLMALADAEGSQEVVQ